MHCWFWENYSTWNKHYGQWFSPSVTCVFSLLPLPCTWKGSRFSLIEAPMPRRNRISAYLALNNYKWMSHNKISSYHSSAEMPIRTFLMDFIISVVPKCGIFLPFEEVLSMISLENLRICKKKNVMPSFAGSVKLNLFRVWDPNPHLGFKPIFYTLRPLSRWVFFSLLVSIHVYFIAYTVCLSFLEVISFDRNLIIFIFPSVNRIGVVLAVHICCLVFALFYQKIVEICWIHLRLFFLHLEAKSAEYILCWHECTSLRITVRF